MEPALKPICILGALGWETAPIRWGLRLKKVKGNEAGFFEGIARGRKVLLVRTGMGGKEATSSGEIAIRRWNPAAMINIGFAGGLSPEARPGLLVLAERVLGQGVQNPEGIAAPSALLKLAESSAAKLALTYRVGSIVTVHPLVATAQDKARLAELTEALAVDMESGYLAQLAAQASIPFLAARFVADACDTTLPAMPQLNRQFLFPLFTPRNLAQLPGLSTQWVKATRTYLLFLKRFLESFPEAPLL